MLTLDENHQYWLDTDGKRVRVPAVEAQAAHEMRYLREMVRRNQEREALEAQLHVSPHDGDGNIRFRTRKEAWQPRVYLFDGYHPIWDGLIFVCFVIAVLGLLNC